MTEPLSFSGLRVVLGGRTVLDGVSLVARRGDVLGVLGRNGSGKTTLLRAGLGLVRPAAGQALLAGRESGQLSEPERAALAGYLPQERLVAWNLPAWRLAALGLPGVPLRRVREAALAGLESVGAGGLADRGAMDLSGGERARVLIARLLLADRPLLVADEPAAGLDPDAQLQVMELFRARANEGGAVMVSLHDLTLAANWCDRLAVLAAGRLVAVGRPAEVLTSETLRVAFSIDGALVPTAHGLVVASRRRSQTPVRP